MSLVHTDLCPACQKPLEKFDGPIEYRCDKHYAFATDIIGEPFYLVIFIPGFELQYSWIPFETYIFAYVDDIFARKLVCTLQEHFPINWNDLNQTTDRIKNLIIFS